jgi:transposase InsO family protein
MCAFFGISRAAYYAWVKRLDQADPDAERMEQVQEAYEKSHRTYGYRRITLWLHKQKGVCLNHKAVLRLMNKLNIRSVARQRKTFRKAGKAKIHHQYANLLNRAFVANHPNRKWVTDVTFIATCQGWAYLSTIQDLFDGFIVSHQVGRQNSLGLVLNTLKQAKQKEQVTDEVLLHSDHGYQYTSHGYALLANDFAMTPSMSRLGNCWDNAPMESFFSHLKEEALRPYPIPNFEEAKLMIDDYIHFYNYERIQLKTRQTPFETRCLSS